MGRGGRVTSRGVRLALCTRVECPFGTPCTDGGVERVVAAIPYPAFCVCTTDRKVVWENNDALRMGVTHETLAAEALPAAMQPGIDAVLDEAAIADHTMRYHVAHVTDQDARGEIRFVGVSAHDGRNRQVVAFVQPAPTDMQLSRRAAELETALRDIAQLLSWRGLAPEPTRRPLASLAGAENLTPREREVLAMVAAGSRVASIAARMYVSPSTVRNYLSAIYTKLGVNNRAELMELVFTGSVDREAP